MPDLSDSPVPLLRGPFLELLGIYPEMLTPGQVRVRLVVEAEHLRSRAIAHGGVLATLMDTSLGLAAKTIAREGYDVVTAQLNVNFVRPARPGETVLAVAEVKHSGRKTAVAWAEARTEGGELVATGSATLVYLPITDFPPEPGDTSQPGNQP